MAVDASIFSGIQPVQQANPLATLAQAYQLRGMQSQADRADREVAQQQGISDAYKGALSPDGTIDRNKLLTSVAGGGYGAAIPGIQKSFSEQDKSSRDAEKAKYEGMLKQFEVAGQIMSGVTDQASWDRARAMTAQAFGPEKAAQMPAEYNPALIAENQQKAMAVKDQVEQRYKALTFAETQRHNKATEGATVRGQDLTASTSRRGQDMTDDRAREFNANRASEGRFPSGYEPDPAKPGALRPIQGGPADPNTPKGKSSLTEGQSKALLFGSRMQEANEIFDTLEKDGKVLSTPGANLGYGVGAAVNLVNTGAGQKLDQAKRNFINAVLRKESGAVISPEEFANANQQYFPQPGDGAEVIEQKRQNRMTAQRGMLEEVPDAEARVARVRGGSAGAPPAPAAPAAPASGGIINVTNAADYAKVPSGATYQTPDGKTRRKP